MYEEINPIITTKELAKIYKVIDSFLIQRCGIDFVSLLETDLGEYTTEAIMMVLLQFDEIRQIVEEYNLYEIIYNSIEEFRKKKIFKLSNQDLSITLQKPENIKDLNALLTEEELRKVFLSLENNLHLYEKLYEDKIWVIDSSIGRRERITISPKRLFHILGLEERVIKNNMQEFESVFKEVDNIKSLMTDRQNLYSVLEKILDNEETIINAALEGRLNHTFNFPKIEMKNYSFERMGILEHSSGMIFYDKNLDKTDEAKTSHLQSNLFLLNDFIRNYDLDFIFSAYRPYKHSMYNTKKKRLNIKDLNSENNILTSDAETLFISDKGENSRFLDGQLSSISTGVGSYHKKNFDYEITLEEDDAIDYIEFTDEDMTKVAGNIISGLPGLDNSHLKRLYNDLKNSIDNTNNHELKRK